MFGRKAKARACLPHEDPRLDGRRAASARMRLLKEIDFLREDELDRPLFAGFVDDVAQPRDFDRYVKSIGAIRDLADAAEALDRIAIRAGA